MNEHIKQFVEARVEIQEEELDKNLGERMLKAAVVATAGVSATALVSAVWDATRNRPKPVELEVVDDTQNITE